MGKRKSKSASLVSCALLALLTFTSKSPWRGGKGLSGPTQAEATAFRRRRRLPVKKKLYDTSVGSFDPNGSIHQIEYAGQAVNKGSLALGLQVRDGVVLAAHVRKQSPLLLTMKRRPKKCSRKGDHSILLSDTSFSTTTTSTSKIVVVHDGLYCALCGLLPDGWLLLDRLKQQALQHWFEYDEAIGVTAAVRCLSNVALTFNNYKTDTAKGGGGSGGNDDDDGDDFARPLGVGMLIAGKHTGTGKPVLMSLLPSGAYTQWTAKAMGQHSLSAEEELARVLPADCRCGDDLSIEDGMRCVLRVMKHTLGNEFNLSCVEMVVVTADHEFVDHGSDDDRGGGGDDDDDDDDDGKGGGGDDGGGSGDDDDGKGGGGDNDDNGENGDGESRPKLQDDRTAVDAISISDTVLTASSLLSADIIVPPSPRRQKTMTMARTVNNSKGSWNSRCRGGGGRVVSRKIMKRLLKER